MQSFEPPVLLPDSPCLEGGGAWGSLYSEQVRIQDFVKEGPQVLRPKVADIVKQSHANKVSNLLPGSRARLRALEAFGFLMLM